eukprot:1159832-Pelagomonas_calceolata.AAC.10
MVTSAQGGGPQCQAPGVRFAQASQGPPQQVVAFSDHVCDRRTTQFCSCTSEGVTTPAQLGACTERLFGGNGGAGNRGAGNREAPQGLPV